MNYLTTLLTSLAVALLAACQSDSTGYNQPAHSDSYYYGPVYPAHGYPVFRQEYPHPPSVDERLDKAERSIDRGSRKGKLSDTESRLLNQEVNEINMRAEQMKADGRFSQRDRKEINQDINQLERKIRRGKHDRERD